MLKRSGQVQTNFEVVFDAAMLIISIILVILGFGGLIMIITTYESSNEFMNYIFVFIYGYMFVFGALLLKYHKKILVRKKFEGY